MWFQSFEMFEALSVVKPMSDRELTLGIIFRAAVLVGIFVFAWVFGC